MRCTAEVAVSLVIRGSVARETRIHLCVGAKGTRNSMIYASSKLDMLITIWNGQAAKHARV